MMKITLIHKQAYYSMFLLPLFALLAGSCKKEKLSNTIPLLNVANQSASSIRLFNYYGAAADVTVNNIPLTAYSTGSTNSTGGTTIGLSIFPTGEWQSGDDASPFTLPNSLLDKDGKAHFTMLTIGTLLAPVKIDTTIVNDVAHPQDYYLLPNGHIRALNRDNLPSSNSQNFKIRIINFGSNLSGDPLGLGLNGPVSLTYADGSQVDPALNNVGQGAASGYVEIPYGSYQFKLFIGGAAIDVTKQLAESPNPPYYDPCNPSVHAQQGISPRVRTFKPGGVYSIVVTENNQSIFTDCAHFSHGAFINSYRVITELDPGVNSTYARMQAVNALPGKQVTITVDGKPLGSQLPYIGSLTSSAAQQPPYQIYVQGNHHIQATDQSGSVLAEGDLMLYPYDNYTVWAYNKPNGKPAILFEPNDMSGTVYATTYHPNGISIPDDGTSGTSRRTQYNYALEARFLNLSPDLPYATLTNDHQLLLPAISLSFFLDTVRYFSAYVNQAPGVLPLNNPNIIYSLPFISPAETSTPAAGNSEKAYVPQLMRVYQSKPGAQPEVPGTLLTNVAPVTVYQAFIANPNLYASPKLQNAETGVYTVALVGQTVTATQPAEQARLIVIKHNK